MNDLTLDEPPVIKLTFDFEGVRKCFVQYYPTHIYLQSLVILDTHQGRGIGSRVLRELKRKGQRIELISYPGDPERFDDLRRFYERNGFTLDDGQDIMFWNP